MVKLEAIQNEYVVLILLQQNQDLSFSQLRYKSNLKKSTLSRVLERLQTRNLVGNFVEKREGTRDHSFYRLTEKGKSSPLVEIYEEILRRHQIDYSVSTSGIG